MTDIEMERRKGTSILRQAHVDPYCCGIVNLGQLQGNPENYLKSPHVIKFLRIRAYNLFTFSDVAASLYGGQGTKGQALAAYITKNNLGTISVTEAPGIHGYNIELFVWKSDRKALTEWVHKQEGSNKPADGSTAHAFIMREWVPPVLDLTQPKPNFRYSPPPVPAIYKGE